MPQNKGAAAVGGTCGTLRPIRASTGLVPPRMPEISTGPHPPNTTPRSAESGQEGSMRRRPSIPKSCEQCGATFLADPYEHRIGQARFCNRVCANRHRSKLARRPRIPRPLTDARSTIEKLSFPVTECGCWIWISRASSRGYGVAKFNGRRVSAHRLSYQAFSGAPIPEGNVVMHRCDTPLCVNPSHLRIGTIADNVADRFSKGRLRVGTWTYTRIRVNRTGRRYHQITSEIIDQVLSHRGRPQAEIARIVGISNGSVNNILAGRHKLRSHICQQ